MNRRFGRSAGLLAAAVAAALIAPGAALAGLQPLPVVDVFTDDRVEDVTLTASPLGDVVVGWTGQNNPPATVLAAFRPGDGPFAPVEFLSTAANGERPSFVFEPDGTVLGVWSHATNTVPGEFASRPRTLTFAPAQNLPSGERFAVVAIDGTGAALAAWKSFVIGGNDLVVASRRSPGGGFEAPIPLSVPIDDNFIQPTVAVNAGGEAVVAWQRDAGPDAAVIEARIGTVAGPSFGPLQVLASEAGAEDSLSPPVSAIGPGGEAIVVWTRSTGDANSLEYAVRAPGIDSFGPLQTLAPGAFGARIGIDAAGTAVVAFTQGAEGARGAAAIVKPPGGPPGPIVPIGPLAQGVSAVSVTFDGARAAVVGMFRTIAPGNAVAEVARRPAGGIFEPAVKIADLGAGVRLAVAAEPDGDVAAAWRVATAPGTVVLRAGGLDNQPDATAAGRGRCAAIPARPRAAAGSGSGFALDQRQLLINQRISQAAIRRLNGVQRWLDDGLLRRDLCGGGIGIANLDRGITAGSGAPATTLTVADPRPIVTAGAAPPGATAAVAVSAGQLLINQRISQAAVRRANALEARLAAGLTGGDLRDGQISQAQLAAGLRILAAIPAVAPPASRTVLAAGRPAGRPAAVAVSARQLRINQRISQAAVRRANGLVDTLRGGFSGGDFRAGSITAADLAPELA